MTILASASGRVLLEVGGGGFGLVKAAISDGASHRRAGGRSNGSTLAAFARSFGLARVGRADAVAACVGVFSFRR